MLHVSEENIRAYYANQAKKIFPYLKAEQCQRLVADLWPKINRIEPKDGFDRFIIQMSQASNWVGAVLGGDYNAEHHLEGDTLQTIPLIALCSAITSQFCPGYVLTKITPDVSFKTSVNVGENAIMRIRQIAEKGPIRQLQLDGKVEVGNRTMFKQPRTLSMFRNQ